MTKIKITKKQTLKPIAPFKTIEEEAHFWDTHSVVNRVHKGTLVGFHQTNKTHTITIRFEPDHLQILRRKAIQQGIGPTTLARMWILQNLKQ